MSTEAQPNTPATSGGYDVVTARILVSGLLACELACICGIVACHMMGQAVPGSLSHLASGIAGALAPGFTAIFKGRANGV